MTKLEHVVSTRLAREEQNALQKECAKKGLRQSAGVRKAIKHWCNTKNCRQMGRL